MDINQPKRAASEKSFTLKFFLPQLVVGMLAGGVVGFIIGVAVAPTISSFLVKPSVFILDPSAIIVSFLVIGMITLGSAAIGMYAALRMANRTVRE